MYGNELIVDSFAGGGGASLGIYQATGVEVDIAINHDAAAIAMHAANHPTTKHYTEDIWEVDPREACQGRKVALAWFSPDLVRRKAGSLWTRIFEGLHGWRFAGLCL